MAILFLILIILTSVVISLFILVQNPKGGGLSGAIAGFNNQFMGVKQTTDVLEKGTWILAILIAVLSIVSPVFFSEGSGRRSSEPNLRPSQTQSAPAAPVLPQPSTPTPGKP